MLALHEMVPASGKKKKRIGRGGSRGGTSGRGHKGQKARSGGNVAVGFEGGQMPLYRRLPKRGFTNARFQTEVQIVNLSDLERVFSEGEKIGRKELIEKGLIKRLKANQSYKVKVLGNQSLSKKLEIHVDAFSKSARASIENGGGQAVANKEK